MLKPTKLMRLAEQCLFAAMVMPVERARAAWMSLPYKPVASLLLRVCGFCVFLSLSVSVQAVTRVDLFTVAVDVESRSSQERTRAASIALEEIYVRTTGDTKALDNFPGLRRELSAATGYLASYQYMESSTVLNKESSAALNEEPLAALDRKPSALNGMATSSDNNNVKPEAELVQLQAVLIFEERAIRDSLKRNNAPYWQASRPAVLVWLVSQAEGETNFATEDASSAYVRALQKATLRRGIPLILPQLGLEEQFEVAPEDVWQMRKDALLGVSSAYKADIILAGKVSMTYRGLLGQWHRIELPGASTHRYETDSIDDFVTAGIDQLANELASQFATSSTMGDSGFVYPLTIQNIHSPRDYTDLIEHLNAIDAIRGFSLVEIVQDRVKLHVDFSDDPTKVQSLITLSGKLVHVGYEGELAFQWSN